MRRRRSRWAPPLAAAVLLLSGCGGDDGLPDSGAVDGGGASEAVVEWPAGERGEPVAVSGTTAEGEALDVADLRGGVVVLNVWYATCAPCRVEAPVLQAVSQEYAERGVRFVGVNVRNDSAEAVLAFQRTYGTTYPSIRDTEGAAQTALRGVAPRATPSTVVLDAQGRPAATVSGAVEESTLTALLDTVLAEGAAPATTPATTPATGSAG